jgi:hypothetical protein
VPLLCGHVAVHPGSFKDILSILGGHPLGKILYNIFTNFFLSNFFKDQTTRSIPIRVSQTRLGMFCAEFYGLCHSFSRHFLHVMWYKASMKKLSMFQPKLCQSLQTSKATKQAYYIVAILWSVKASKWAPLLQPNRVICWIQDCFAGWRMPTCCGTRVPSSVYYIVAIHWSMKASKRAAIYTVIHSVYHPPFFT